MQLWQEFQPHWPEPEHALLSAVIQLSWSHAAEHKARPFMEVLLVWKA